MPEREITVRVKKPVLCCTHCGRHPAIAYIFRYAEDENESKPTQVDLCAACAMRIGKMMEPIISRPRAPKPAAAPKPKRGRPRKTAAERLEARAAFDEEANVIKAENDIMLGR